MKIISNKVATGSCTAESDAASLRCACGNLLARYLPSGEVELKCRRCKRTVIIPIEKASQAERP